MSIEVSIKQVRELAATIQYECISYPAMVVKHLPDGTKIVHNENGDIVFAHYSSGIRLIRHDRHVVLTSQSGDHWIGGLNNRWLRFD